MKIRQNKKALSPVITTILLVLLAIILAVIILLWARGFIAEKISKFDPVQNEERPISEVCGRAQIQGYYVTSPNEEVYVTNVGSIPVYSVDVSYTSAGTKQLIEGQLNLTAGTAGVIRNVTGIGSANEVSLIPVLLGKSDKGGIKQYTCTKNSIVIKPGGE
jgi:flagellin-like protein